MSRSQRLYLYTAATAGYLFALGGAILFAWEAAAGLAGGQGLARNGLLGLGALLVGLIFWLLHFAIANRQARPLTVTGAVERSTAPRKAHFHLSSLVALAAVVAQAYYAGFGLLAATPLVGAYSLAAGSAVALVFWIVMRLLAGADRDAGDERPDARWPRRLYTYLAAGAGSALLIAGAGELLRTGLKIAVQPLAGLPWRESVESAGVAMVIGIPLAIFAWRWANRVATRAPESELNAPQRLLVQYGALTAGTVAALAALAYLLQQIVLYALGRDLGPYWQIALAYLPVALVTWITFSGAIGRDNSVVGETRRRGRARRLTRYVVALAGLAAFAFGIVEFLRFILAVTLRVQAPGEVFSSWWDRFALASALVLVGAPAWWGHWWPQQVRARALDRAGHLERKSWARRLYLLLAVLGSAVLAFIALGIAGYLLFNWRSNPADTSALRAALAGAGASVTVGLFWWVFHALVLRGDGRLLAKTAANADGEGESDLESPGVVSGAARSYTREELAAATATDRPDQWDAMAAAVGGKAVVAADTEDAQAGRDPRCPVMVIDGLDGAVGAAVISALIEAVPDVMLWPVGLNPRAQRAMLQASGARMAPVVPADAPARAAAVIGPSDILIAGGLEGEVPAALAVALGSSPARVLLLPARESRFKWIAAPEWSLDDWVQNAIVEVQSLLSV